MLAASLAAAVAVLCTGGRRRRGPARRAAAAAPALLRGRARGLRPWRGPLAALGLLQRLLRALRLLLCCLCVVLGSLHAHSGLLEGAPLVGGEGVADLLLGLPPRALDPPLALLARQPRGLANLLLLVEPCLLLDLYQGLLDASPLTRSRSA